MTENQNLEGMIKQLDLGDLAMQVAASDYAGPQYKGDKSNPEYVDVAIQVLEDSMGDSEKDKYEWAVNSLKVAHAQAGLSAKQNGGVYHLNDVLNQYFTNMKKGYALTLENSTLGDLNTALAKLGYTGEKLDGDEKLTVKEVMDKLSTEGKIDKEKLENASEEDKLMFNKVNYAMSILTELARAKLTYGSADSEIKALNEAGKPKEEKKEGN